MQTFDDMIRVLDLLRNIVKIIRGTIINQQFALAVKNNTPERGNMLQMNTILFGFYPVGWPIDNLKKPQAQKEDSQG